MVCVMFFFLNLLLHMYIILLIRSSHCLWPIKEYKHDFINKTPQNNAKLCEGVEKKRKILV